MKNAEQMLLKKLGIPDFRHLTKDHVISMYSMLDKIHPDVAKKALEQFPEFSKTIKEILAEYKESLDNSLAINKDSVQAYYDSCNTIIESLQAQLEEEELTFEEKKYIIDRMIEVSKMMGEKDSENKKFIAAMNVIGGFTVAAAAVVLASSLGGGASFGESDESEDDELKFIDET